MERLRSRSAANTVAPLRIATMMSGVSMLAYTSEISRPSCCTRREMRSDEIIARPGIFREPRAPGAGFREGASSRAIFREFSPGAHYDPAMGRHDVERFDRWAPSYERHWMQRVLFGRIQQAVLDAAASQVPDPVAVLDVGCGTGRLLRATRERFPSALLAGIDPAPEMVRQARSNTPPGAAIEFQEGAAESLPFRADEFDLVFSTMTFHHWADQARAAGEIRRVLTVQGRWVLADLMARGVMRYIRRLFKLNRMPERSELDAMLREQGLQIVGTRSVRGLGSQVAVLAIGRKD